MENLNKAITMAGHVMIFLVALTSGIFLYQTLISAQETILLNSEYYSREAEHVRENLDTTRVIYGSEVISFLVSRIESNGYYGSNVIVYNNGSEIYDSRETDYLKKIKSYDDLKSKIGLNKEYGVTYSYSGDYLQTITYTAKD